MWCKLISLNLQAIIFANSAALKLLGAKSSEDCKHWLDAEIGGNPGLMMVFDSLIRQVL